MRIGVYNIIIIIIMSSLNVFGNVVDLGAVFVGYYSPLSRSGVCTQHYTILHINNSIMICVCHGVLMIVES